MLRVAIFGAGSMANVYARCIHQTNVAELRFVASRSIESAQQLANKYNVKGYTIDQIKGDLAQRLTEIDCVFYCLSEQERNLLLRLFDLNVHVLFEKPLTISANEFKQFRSHSRVKSDDVITMPAFVEHFDETNRLFLKHLESSKSFRETLFHIDTDRHGWPSIYERVRGRFSPSHWLVPHDLYFLIRIAKVYRSEFQVLDSKWIGKKQGIAASGVIADGLTFVSKSYFGANLEPSMDVEITKKRVWGINGVSTLMPGLRSTILGNDSELLDLSYAPVVGGEISGAFLEMTKSFFYAIRNGAANYKGPTLLDAINVAENCFVIQEMLNAGLESNYK